MIFHTSSVVCIYTAKPHALYMCNRLRNPEEVCNRAVPLHTLQYVDMKFVLLSCD